MLVCFIRQVLTNQLAQKVVTVNGITYTAWDTLNVTNMRVMFSKSKISNNLSINNWICLKLLLCQLCFMVQVSMKILEQM
jgi:hypothetical protein